MADISAASALALTLLVPVCGVLWGRLVFDEPVGWSTAVGACVVTLGTVLVTGFAPAWPLAKKPA